MALSDDLARIAAAAQAYAAPGEELAGVLAAEPARARRIYLCAFADEAGETAWIALDDGAVAVERRRDVREAASIVAMCELAEENAGGGELEELRSQLATLRLTENPPGIEEAEVAALALEQAVGAPPRLATPDYLDAVGVAARELERALGDAGRSPFAEALKSAAETVDEFLRDVEGRYKTALR